MVNLKRMGDIRQSFKIILLQLTTNLLFLYNHSTRKLQGRYSQVYQLLNTPTIVFVNFYIVFSNLLAWYFVSLHSTEPYCVTHFLTMASTLFTQTFKAQSQTIWYGLFSQLAHCRALNPYEYSSIYELIILLG